MIAVAAVIQPQQVGIVGVNQIHPPAGRCEMFFQQSGVSIVLIHPPGHDGAGIGPGRRTIHPQIWIAWVRGDVGIMAIVGLRVADIAHPLGEESGHVHVEDCRLRECLDVTHPAFALGPLGAIRGHTV